MALTVGSITSSKGVPKSVAQITKDAAEYEFDAIVPLKYYLRTANAMVRQVCYEQDHGRLPYADC